MIEELRKEFRQYLKENQLWYPGQRILLACSGGVDSMVLAHLLKVEDINFALAHCHFQLRGEASDLDAALVEDWAREHGLAFFQTRFETRAKAEEWGMGIQETARRLRYEWLHQIRKQEGFTWLATAHHRNDQVETVLMNFFKGTGIAGMRGILPRTEGLIRPLLFAEKRVLIDYAHSHGLKYREDESNSQDDYLRNALRIHLLPKIEEWFPGAAARMGKTIDHMREAAELYDQAVQAQKKRLMEPRGKDMYLPIRKWKLIRPKKTIAFELFRDYGFRSSQIDQILHLMDAGPGQWVGSSSHQVIRDRDFLIITPWESRQSDYHLIESIPFGLDLGDFHLEGEQIGEALWDKSSGQQIFIRPESLEFPLVLRRRKAGDYFYPLGMGGKKKKLSRFFIEKKIPLHEKDSVWVLESRNRIVWVLGWRMDERFKVLHPQGSVIELRIKPKR